MNTKLIITILFIGAAQSSMLKYLLSLKDNPIYLEKCYEGISHLFMNDSGLEQSDTARIADSTHHKICPQVDQTCCSTEGLQEQFNHFKKGYANLRKYFVIFGEASAVIKKSSLKTIKIDIFDKDFDIEQVKTHSKEQLEQELMGTIQQLQAESGTLGETIAYFYSGFMCGFCHPSVRNYINAGNRRREEHPSLKMDRDATIPLILTLQDEYIKYLKGMTQMNYIMRILFQKSGMEELEEHLDAAQFKKQLFELDDFHGKMLNYPMIIENFKLVFPIFNQFFGLNTRVSMYSKLKDLNVAMWDYLMRRFPEQNLSPKSADNFERTIFFSVEQASNRFSFQNFRNVFTEDGFDMRAYQYAEKEWLK